MSKGLLRTDTLSKLGQECKKVGSQLKESVVSQVTEKVIEDRYNLSLSEVDRAVELYKQKPR